MVVDIHFRLLLRWMCDIQCPAVTPPVRSDLSHLTHDPRYGQAAVLCTYLFSRHSGQVGEAVQRHVAQYKLQAPWLLGNKRNRYSRCRGYDREFQVPTLAPDLKAPPTGY